ncbi:Flp family type IVb pilin [Qipengyuania sp. JC766]|uniref:Flp family type IVb pilin n=1 Tax=Qipengyuania sp. JC766 TaxID=3232139 RepID=UPI0034581E18
MSNPLTLRRFLRDESGATAVEYGLIVSLIVIAMVGALESVANENTGLWGRVSSTVVDVIGHSGDEA